MRARADGVLDRSDLDALFVCLRNRGFRVLGPRLTDQVVALSPIESSADLEPGWRDLQETGRYRLERTGEPFLFDCGPGPTSIKHWVHPPQVLVWRARREGDTLTFQADRERPPALAVVGVRACDLHALTILDRVLLGGDHPDPGYQARREPLFLVAVTCRRAGGTCFCASMTAGPRVTEGADLVLTEIADAAGHRFLVEVLSARGASVAAELPLRSPTVADCSAPELAAEAASQGQRRWLRTDGLSDALDRRVDDPRWQDVAARCLACGNCTAVCPTCFCTTLEDSSSLDGACAERRSRWDSCFTLDHSYIHGGSVRASVAARYRQWLMHKLATWRDQFGTAGCVGCGRCITWCPAGIDITAEARALALADTGR